jgi:glucose/mannose transport system substrate-binding protein
VSFDDPGVKTAMETYAKMLDYQNEDHSALSWDQAVKKLMEGRLRLQLYGRLGLR